MAKGRWGGGGVGSVEITGESGKQQTWFFRAISFKRISSSSTCRLRLAWTVTQYHNTGYITLHTYYTLSYTSQHLLHYTHTQTHFQTHTNTHTHTFKHTTHHNKLHTLSNTHQHITHTFKHIATHLNTTTNTSTPPHDITLAFNHTYAHLKTLHYNKPSHITKFHLAH